ncbi:MAG: AMP-binding protein, partial [Rhodospirillales bacterium]|nr:AMP-binding protein [Rhodospirillales bacterium]
GEQGEICLRGPQIMLGYRNRPEETAAALRQGWLFTGDIGELDEFLYTHPDVIEAKLLLPRLYSGMAAA